MHHIHEKQTVPSDKRDRSINTRFNFAQDFDSPQFHNVERLPYLNWKQFNKIWGIIKIPLSHSLWLPSKCLQNCTNPKMSVFKNLPTEGNLVNILRVVPWTKFIKGMVFHQINNHMIPKQLMVEWKEKSCTNDWVAYTNEKAVVANDDTGAGSTYPTSTPFNPCDTERYNVLYIVQGLSPSIFMSTQLYTQKKDPTNGNDAVALLFSPGAQTGFSHFKGFGCRIQ